MIMEFIQSKNMGKKDVKKKPAKIISSKSSTKSKDKSKNGLKQKSPLKKGSSSLGVGAKKANPAKVTRSSKKSTVKTSVKSAKIQSVKSEKSSDRTSDKKKKLLGKSKEASVSSQAVLKKGSSLKKDQVASSSPKTRLKNYPTQELSPKKMTLKDEGESVSVVKSSIASKKNVEPHQDDLKTISKKTTKSKKTEDSGDLDDVGFITDEIGDDEIGEYAEELKAVEEMDSEGDDSDAWILEGKDRSEEEIVLTDAEGRRYCRSRDCDQIAMVDGYCRYHYLLFWKKIQIRKKILADGKLEKYVEELTSRYPDKFLEMIRRDLRTEKDFLSAIQELEIDEGAIENEFEEDAQSFIEEVRVMGETASVDDDDY